MRNLRNIMLVAVVAAAALAAIGGFFLGGPPIRILVDAGLAVALAIIVAVMLSPTVARTEALVEALRALARGDKHQRVNPDEFAGLAEVARAMNEVAASLTENIDPNLGPVKSTPRPKSGRQNLPRPERVDDPRAIVEMSDHPEIGPVRVMKKQEPIPLAPGKNGDATTKGAAVAAASAASTASASVAAKKEERAEASMSASMSASTSSAPSSGVFAAMPESGSTPVSSVSSVSNVSNVSKDAKAGAERPTTAAATNDTNVDAAPRSDIGPATSSSSGASASDAPMATVPSRAELEALFQEFVAAKKSHDEAVADLDFDAFAQTIQGECERLISAHRCRGVRFEVTMQDGEVSLRPRLLR